MRKLFLVLLQKAEADGSIEGVKICVEAPKINHLFFADVSLIAMKAMTQSASKLLEILALYEAQSW